MRDVTYPQYVAFRTAVQLYSKAAALYETRTRAANDFSARIVNGPVNTRRGSSFANTVRIAASVHLQTAMQDALKELPVYSDAEGQFYEVPAEGRIGESLVCVTHRYRLQQTPQVERIERYDVDGEWELVGRWDKVNNKCSILPKTMFRHYADSVEALCNKLFC